MPLSSKHVCALISFVFGSLFISIGSARAEFIEFYEKYDEIQGGVYLREALHLSLQSDQVQKMISGFEFYPRDWDIQKFDPEWRGDQTYFQIILNPRLSKFTESIKSDSDVNPQDQKSSDHTHLITDSTPSTHAQSGWWGYWDRAKVVVSGATSLAMTAAQSVGGYALYSLSQRKVAGSISHEALECPAPYSPQGLRLVFNLDESDPLVMSVMNRFALNLCYDEKRISDEGIVSVRMKIEMDPGVAYASLIRPESALFAAESLSQAWFTTFQTLVSQNEVKHINQTWSVH